MTWKSALIVSIFRVTSGCHGSGVRSAKEPIRTKPWLRVWYFAVRISVQVSAYVSVRAKVVILASVCSVVGVEIALIQSENSSQSVVWAFGSAVDRHLMRSWSLGILLECKATPRCLSQYAHLTN